MRVIYSVVIRNKPPSKRPRIQSRVFGLIERVNEGYDNIKQYVIDSVLKIACPDVEWN